MRFIRIIVPCLTLLVVAFVFSCCSKVDSFAGKQTKPEDHEDPGGDQTATFELAPCTNRIVAHRGGASECGSPDNSRASLGYAIKLKLYASECDIYWTKDNEIIIAHASDTYFVNGLRPYESTLEQIRRAGKLSNGEEIPTLGEFLDLVMVSGNCTKLWLDIKNYDGNLTQYPIKAVQRACEIIKERHAEKCCEFICTANKTVAITAAGCMQAYGIPVGWMAPSSPAAHKSYGFTWANLSAKTHLNSLSGGSGNLTIDQFLSAGMQISVFNVDSKAGDWNAVFSSEAVDYFVRNYARMKAICTNYPKWLLSKVN